MTDIRQYLDSTYLETPATAGITPEEYREKARKYIQEAIGYTDFFWLVMICCFATVVVTIFADRRIDPEYGKK